MMGARLATLSLAYAPADLTDRARVVLLVMCLQARDSGQKPGLYFGGWQFLAERLGYPTYDVAAKQAVARAMRELADAKLIDRWDVSRGHRVAYRVLPYVPGAHQLPGS